MPVRLPAGAILYGSINAGEAFGLLAERTATESAYAGIVQLMEQAQASRAPMARLAEALQSVAAGIGLSALGMAAAAGGLLTPVAGAVLQEAIDAAVILNALRTLCG